jgi:hypothetical protein
LDGLPDQHLLTPAATGSSEELQRAYHQNHPSQGATTDHNTEPEIATSNARDNARPYDDGDDDFGQLCFDFEINTRSADSMIPSTCTPEQPAPSQAPVDDDFDNDLMDEDLLDLMTDTMSNPSSPLFQSSSPVKLSVLDKQTPRVSAITDNSLSDRTSSSSRSLQKFVSPVTLTSRILAATGDEARKPIARPPFPTAVRDRSPIIGMSSNTVLRTCFRVGEAISQSCHAANVGNNILIELYAKVLNSERDDLQQRFTFCDLFHAKPPYIQANYAASIWKSVQLFEYDSSRLMQQGRICRCIGTMKRNGKDWVMTVLNIWEATWDDVQWVEGIVSS